MPAQLVNEHVESQAKHMVDPKALACIISGEMKTKQWKICANSLSGRCEKQQKMFSMDWTAQFQSKKENT